MKSLEIKIEGMHCEHCVETVRRALLSLDMIRELDISLPKGCARLDFEGEDLDEKKLVSAIEALGFEAEILP